jgi:type IV pilus assembly protein PilY1
MSTSLKKFVGSRFLRFAVCALVLAVTTAVALYYEGSLFADDRTPCKAPPFLNEAVPPMLMLTVSKDHTNYFMAYSDTQKLMAGCDTIQTTYTNNINYYGYFDSAKCYTYDSTNKYFKPDSITSNHRCSGKWSGNFLNWATMARIDTLRKVLYGGYRSTDADNSTILERTYLPDEGHSWVKVYKGSDLGDFTPYSGSLPSGSNSTISIYNVTCNSYMDLCSGSYSGLPVMRVAAGAWSDWDAGETWQGYFGPPTSGSCSAESGHVSDNAATDPPCNMRPTSGAVDLAVRVKACPAMMLGNETLCREYSPGKFKPIGLLQKYGETDSMHFGLITGSYNTNISGGVLRKRIRSIKNEINPDGTFANVNGIIKTLNTFKLVNHPGYGGYYSGCGPFTNMAENTNGCRNWGNPIGGMLYEALRYYAGKGSATSVFDGDDSGYGLSKDSWNDPYNDANSTYDHSYCSKPNILIVSDVYPSYDDIKMPGSIFSSSFSGDVSGFNATKLTNYIGANEPNDNATFPGRFFIGRMDGNSTNAQTCVDKTVGGLGTVKGLCPGYPGVNGTFYTAAATYFGRTNDLRDGTIGAAIVGKPSTYRINPATMAVAVADPLPTIEIKTQGGKISVSPVNKSLLYTTTAGKSPLTNGNYKKARYLPPPSGYTGAMEIVWEDSYQASDFDKDWTQRIQWKVNGNDVDIETSLYMKTSGASTNFGYVVSGSTADAVYMDIKAYGLNYTTPTTNTCSGSPCTYSNFRSGHTSCYLPDYPFRDFNATDDHPCAVTFSRRTFTAQVPASANSKFLKDPLWYAAKWGGFSDSDAIGGAGYGLPDKVQEWDTNGDGVPDTYYKVSNPGDLFDALDRAFSNVILRVGAAGAVATVTQQLQQGDVVVRAAFESYNATNPSSYIWRGHLESYRPYNGCSALTARGDCNSTTGCSWSGSSCSGSLYSFQLRENQGLFCTAMTGTPNCLDSGAILTGQSAGSRQIFTSVNGTSTKSYISAWDNSTLQVHRDFDASGAVGAADVTALKNWVTGASTTAAFLRNQGGWRLGDTVYSTPVAVGTVSVSSVPPQLADANFWTHFSNNLTRDQLVYVGANDGMLHAFNLGFWDTARNAYVFDDLTTYPTTGQERWGYVPSNLLSELQCLAWFTYGNGGCLHRFTVDLSPQAWDVKLVNGWKTLLLGGERGGGDTYFALDVSSPAADNVTPLWEYSVLKNYPASSNVTSKYTQKYSGLKTLPLSWSLPYVGRLRDSGGNGTPVAFIGGGIREFRPDLIQANATIKLNALGGSGAGGKSWRYLYYPSIHAVKLQSDNATNLWRSDWTTFLRNSSFQNTFKVNTTAGSSPVLPYAVGSVAAFDVFDGSGRSVTKGGVQDSYTDLLYAGDLNGTLYTVVLNSKASNTSPTPSCIVGRKVLPVVGAIANPYRGSRQPITVTPVAALDTDGNMRVYFGSGKYDDVPSEPLNDQTDNASMSFYCRLEDLSKTLGNATGSRCTGGNFTSAITSSPYPFLYENCFERNRPRPFNWVKVTDNATNATSADGGNCFKCVFDLPNPGERVIGSALVAGGYVFFTTFVPNSAKCAAGGSGFLYVLDYMCRPLRNPGTVIGGGSGGGGGSGNKFLDSRGGGWTSAPPSSTGAVQVSLGEGMPSPPVLNSTGTAMFIQMSNSKIQEPKVDLGPGARSKIHGWTRQD